MTTETNIKTEFIPLREKYKLFFITDYESDTIKQQINNKANYLIDKKN